MDYKKLIQSYKKEILTGRVYLHAFLDESGDGWSLVVSKNNPELTKIALHERGIKTEKVIEISENQTKPESVPESIKKANYLDKMIAESRGWNFDRTARCWRAPDEPMKEPGGSPKHLNNLIVTITSPGGYDVEFTFKDATKIIATVRGSLTMDDYLAHTSSWLEKIAKGNSPCISFDDEGKYYIMQIYPKSSELVRFRVVEDLRKSDENTSLDNLIERKTLVKAFYLAIAEIKDATYKKELGYPSEIIENYLKK